MTAKHREDIWYEAGIPRQGAELHEAINEGFSYQVYNNLSSVSGLNKKELARITAIPPATLRRRAKAGKFSKDESDRLHRFVKVLNASVELYGGNRETAMRWMNRPVRGLGYRKPIDMIGTSAEADEVIALIRRIEWGVIT